MAVEKLSDYVEATVTSGGTTASSTDTALTVTTTENWLVLAAGQQLRIMDKAQIGTTSGFEVMLLTANANGTNVSWTVQRAVEGTLTAHASNWTAIPVITAAGLMNAFGSGSVPTNVQTGASYSVAASDINGIVAGNSSSAQVFTLQTDSNGSYPTFATGQTIVVEFQQLGTGTVEIEGASGVTVNGVSGGSITISGANQTATAWRTAANTWVVTASEPGPANVVTSAGTAQTLARNQLNELNLTSGDACAITVPPGNSGDQITVQFNQPASGTAGTITWAGATIIWPTTYTLTSTLGKSDLLELNWSVSLSAYIGLIVATGFAGL